MHRSGDLAHFEIVTVDGIPCTDATRTLCDLGTVVNQTVVERALECALRRRDTTLPRLHWRLAQLARPGRSGPNVLRRVLEARPPAAVATDSDAETTFLQLLRDHGLPDPVRQHGVELGDGRTVRLDVAWPDHLVWAEVDGWAFHGTRTGQRQDGRRQNDLVLALGWLPLRFSWEDITFDGPVTAAKVAAALTV